MMVSYISIFAIFLVIEENKTHIHIKVQAKLWFRIFQFFRFSTAEKKTENFEVGPF
jgi:hypothetical protein